MGDNIWATWTKYSNPHYDAKSWLINSHYCSLTSHRFLVVDVWKTVLPKKLIQNQLCSMHHAVLTASLDLVNWHISGPWWSTTIMVRWKPSTMWQTGPNSVRYTNISSVMCVEYWQSHRYSGETNHHFITDTQWYLTYLK